MAFVGLLAVIVPGSFGIAAASASSPQATANRSTVPAPGRYGGGARTEPGHQFELGVYVYKLGGKTRTSVAGWISPHKLVCKPGPYTANAGSPFNEKFYGMTVAGNGAFHGSNSPGTSISGRLSASKIDVTFNVTVYELLHKCTGKIHIRAGLIKQTRLGATPIG